MKTGSHLNCTHLENYCDKVGVEGCLEGSVVKGAEKKRSSSREMGEKKKGGEETENTNRNFIDADPIHKRCPCSK